MKVIKLMLVINQYLLYIDNDWGLGIGDWGLGIGPIPNPQSPIPNPQSPSVVITKVFIF